MSSGSSVWLSLVEPTTSTNKTVTCLSNRLPPASNEWGDPVGDRGGFTAYLETCYTAAFQELHRVTDRLGAFVGTPSSNFGTVSPSVLSAAPLSTKQHANGHSFPARFRRLSSRNGKQEVWRTLNRNAKESSRTWEYSRCLCSAFVLLRRSGATAIAIAINGDLLRLFQTAGSGPSRRPASGRVRVQ